MLESRIAGAITSSKHVNYRIGGKARKNEKDPEFIEVFCVIVKYYRLDGSDGDGSLACIIVVFLPKHIVRKHLSERLMFSVILSSNRDKYQPHFLV